MLKLLIVLSILALLVTTSCTSNQTVHRASLEEIFTADDVNYVSNVEEL